MKNLRWMCLILCLMTLSTILVPAFAEESAPTITPYYTHTNTLVVSLSIKTGQAKAAGQIVPYSNQRTSITVKLQKKGNGNVWSTISTWSGSNTKGASEAGGYKTIDKGCQYRVYVIGKVYDSTGAVVETVSKYSTVKSS